jgi:hypothetical protein
MVDAVLDLLVRYTPYDPRWFDGAARADNTELQWRTLQLLRSNGTAAANRATMVASGAPVVVKSEFPPPPVADCFAPTACCDGCRRVLVNAAPPHTNVDAKRGQRDDVLREVRRALAVPGVAVNVLLLDDVLEGRLLSAEIWAQFPEAAGRLRVFAPNLNPDIVEKLRKLTGVPPGGVVSGAGCVCNFLARWEPLIVATGGFAVVYADVHGSYDTGCGVLLRDLVDRRMLCPPTQPDTFLCFATSDLYLRLKHRSRDAAMRFTEDELLDLTAPVEVPYVMRVRARAHYNTMVYYAGYVHRQHVDVRAVAGFDVVPMLVEQTPAQVPTAAAPVAPVVGAVIVDEPAERAGGDCDALTIPVDVLTDEGIYTGFFVVFSKHVSHGIRTASHFHSS